MKFSVQKLDWVKGEEKSRGAALLYEQYNKGDLRLSNTLNWLSLENSLLMKAIGHPCLFCASSSYSKLTTARVYRLYFDSGHSKFVNKNFGFSRMVNKKKVDGQFSFLRAARWRIRRGESNSSVIHLLPKLRFWKPLWFDVNTNQVLFYLLKTVPGCFCEKIENDNLVLVEKWSRYVSCYSNVSCQSIKVGRDKWGQYTVPNCRAATLPWFHAMSPTFIWHLYETKQLLWQCCCVQIVLFCLRYLWIANAIR